MLKYKTCLKNQTINLKDALIPEHKSPFKPRSNNYPYLILILTSFVLVMAFMTECDTDTAPTKATVNCAKCHNKLSSMTAYFEKKGSKTPEEMAYAVLKTKSPRLLAAIAVVESDGNHTIRNRGYKKRHHGAFQVNPAIWNTVPNDAVGQARQAEAILIELTKNHSIETALNKYGGDSTKKVYANNILKELAEVP